MACRGPADGVVSAQRGVGRQDVRLCVMVVRPHTGQAGVGNLPAAAGPGVGVLGAGKFRGADNRRGESFIREGLRICRTDYRTGRPVFRGAGGVRRNIHPVNQYPHVGRQIPGKVVPRRLHIAAIALRLRKVSVVVAMPLDDRAGQPARAA